MAGPDHFRIGDHPLRTAQAYNLPLCGEFRGLVQQAISVGAPAFQPALTSSTLRLRKQTYPLGGLGSSMLIKIGQIEAIFRYPVKSMRGEQLDAATLGWHGIDGDRRFAFRRLECSGVPLAVREQAPRPNQLHSAAE
jgi:hypothetical protein